MNRYARWAFALAVLPVAACADNTPAPTPAPPAPPPLAAADASFVTSAAQGGMAEIQEAQLALSMARNPKVKAYANKMVTDHTAADDQLKQIAASKNVTLPADISDVQMKQENDLKALKGHAFDREYIADQIADHQEMVTLFQNEATNGTDPELKKFAADTLPTVQQHLTDAQALVAHAQRRMRHHHHAASSSN
ncbi:DUF4142 domain-containing protein [Acetobacteraceae bacterium KSS8]|uniref:DUF4142 domain-containing protein n=1 Tax=Endosaccharibacter trunci TaxID=2812733 RepID=A0ABT1W5W7_9PROT|nr:DUF4142 domain-containing protein [Acetobacteraceae bacterium KSS8]